MTHKNKNPNSAKSVPWWRWLATLVAGILLLILGQIIGSFAAQVISPGETVLFGQVLPMLTLSLVQTSIVVFGVRYVWRIVNGGWRSIGFVSDNWKQDLLYGAVAGSLIALVAFLILPLTGGADRPDIVASAEIAGSSLSSLFAAILLGWLLGAFSEEVFFRGHLIRSLGNLLGGKSWAVAVSSILSITLFASGHASLGRIGVISAGIIGTIYTVLFLWRGRLTTSIVAHGVYDTLAFLYLYFLL